jgi:hypothetical protein
LISIEILPTQPLMRVIGGSVFADELTRITAAPRAERTLSIVGAAIALANSRTFRPGSGRCLPAGFRAKDKQDLSCMVVFGDCTEVHP